MLRLSILVFCLMATTVSAQVCTGLDLRETLTPEEQAQIEDRSSAVPYPIGNHWKATRGDRVIHVIGTVHVSDPRLDAVTERLTPVIAGADALMVEVTQEGERELQRQIATTPELAFLTEGPTLIDLLPPETWADIKLALADRGIPGFLAAKFQPWYLFVSLAIPPCAMRGIAAGEVGLDKRLIAIATASNVPLEQLEDPKTVIQLFGEIPMDEQLQYLSLGVLDTQLANDALFTLMEQYFEEDIYASLEVSRVITKREYDLPDAEFDAQFQAFMSLLLDARNRAWIERIEQLEHKNLVVAAGALHLSGETGVLSLLQQRGYQLDRQAF